MLHLLVLSAPFSQQQIHTHIQADGDNDGSNQHYIHIAKTDFLPEEIEVAIYAVFDLSLIHI